jgi:hypothetical protein
MKRLWDLVLSKQNTSKERESLITITLFTERIDLTEVSRQEKGIPTQRRSCQNEIWKVDPRAGLDALDLCMLSASEQFNYCHVCLELLPLVSGNRPGIFPLTFLW